MSNTVRAVLILVASLWLARILIGILIGANMIAERGALPMCGFMALTLAVTLAALAPWKSKDPTP